MKRLPAYGAVGLALVWMLLARQSVLGSGPWPTEPFVDNPLRGVDFLTARMGAFKVLAHYLAILVFPAKLLFDYSYNQVPVSTSDLGGWAGLLLCAAILGVVIVRRRRDPVLFWAAGFFALAIFPVSNLVVTIGSIMALRFLYLPSIGFAVAVVALVWRLRNEKVAQAILAGLILICAVRTVMRNPAWADDGALAYADVENQTQSYRPYRLLGEFYYRQDPRGNLDRSIGQLETAWKIIEPLPPVAGDQQIPADLGLLYKLKGDQSGGAANPAGRAWYEKSIAILQHGVQILEAQADDFTRQQELHHRERVPFGGNESVYSYAGKTYTAMGRSAEAVQAYRRARELKPTEKEFFDDLATAYAAQGKLEAAAIVIDQKAYTFGLSPATVTSLRNLYARLPEGTCALDEADGRPKLNLGCARLHEHMCVGWADLVKVYDRALQTRKALAVRNEAIQGAGCPADLFAANATLPML